MAIQVSVISGAEHETTPRRSAGCSPSTEQPWPRAVVATRSAHAPAEAVEFAPAAARHTGDVTQMLLLNLVFFIPATCGSAAFALVIYRCLRNAPPPPSPPPGGGRKPPLPAAGPDDLARSA